MASIQLLYLLLHAAVIIECVDLNNHINRVRRQVIHSLGN